MENYENGTPDSRTVGEREDDKTNSNFLVALAVVAVFGAVFFLNRSDTDYDYRTATQTTAPAAPGNTAPNTTRPAR